MRGVVPAECLLREAKAEGSAEDEAGLRVYQAALRALFDEARRPSWGSSTLTGC
jgi:asparagine synthase (glutamine-hydrolysing)